MPKEDKSRKDRSGGHRKEEPREHRPHRREERHEHTGEHKVFNELVQRRLGGGQTPTAEAYTKAMQQWQKLPGAVTFVAVPKIPPSAPGSTGNTTVKKECE